jgi:hypothetical protein
VQTTMLAGLPYARLRDPIIVHLTMAEGHDPLLVIDDARSSAPENTFVGARSA